MHNIEVYKQSKGFTTELEIRDDLSVMHRRDRLDRLDLNHHKVLGQQIDAVTEFESNAAVKASRSSVTLQEKKLFLSGPW